MDGGAAASSSGGAVRAPEAEAKPSLEGAAGTSRPPFISSNGLDAVASVREGQVDVEPHQLYCSTGIMVSGGEDSEPYMVGTILDSGAGISCVSEATVCALQKQLPGVDMVQPCDGEQHQVVLADGWAVRIKRQTCSLTATIMTPWAPVTIRLALAVIPGEDNLLILKSNTLRKKLSIDVMKEVRDTAAASGGGASITEHAPAEEPAMPPEIIGARRVAVTMEAMQLADIEVETAGETNGFEDVLLDREPETMMSFSDRAIQASKKYGVLPDFVVGDYVLVARVRQPGITPKPMNTWTGPWRVVSKPGGHVYGVEDIATGRSREVHIAWMRPYADASLNVTAELKEVFNNLESQGDFDMERIEAVDVAANGEGYVVKMEWVGLDEEETTWEPLSTIYADAPEYVVAQLWKLRFTKKVRDDLKKKYGMKV